MNPYEIKDKLRQLKKTNPNLIIKDLPFCMVDGMSLVFNEWYKTKKILDKNGDIDIKKFTDCYIKNKKIKSLKCRRCIHDKDCEGIFQHYIQIYGFNILKPIVK